MPILGVIASSRAKGIGPIAVNGAGYTINMGKDGSGTYKDTTIQKFVFATEVRTTISATMPDTRGALAGFSNATTAGYLAGGINGSSVFDTTQKLDYSTESRTQISSTFSDARFNNKGLSNSANVAGYFAGGQNLAGTFYTSIRKLPYPTETYGNISNTLSANRAGAGAAGNPSIAGYWIAGYNGSTTTNSADKFPFSSETISSLGNIFPITVDNLGSMNNSGSAAYSVGGNSTGIYKLAYSTDTFSTLGATMPYKNNFSSYNSCPGNYAAIAGARLDPYPNVTNAIQKFTYSTETQSTSGSTLAVAGETSTQGLPNAILGA